MAYPVLAPNRTWFSQGGTATQGSTFTKITIVDSYTPTGDETESWNADVNNTGAIKWYKKGTELIIAGNGSGKIAMNPDSKKVFYLGKDDTFSNVTQIDGLNIFDTTSVSDAQQMFYNMSSLTALDLDSFFTSPSLTNIYGIFAMCSSLVDLSVAQWNLTQVLQIQQAFYGCTSLKNLDLSTWRPTSATKVYAMFRQCTALENLNLTGWTLPKATNASSMFSGCSSLTTVDTTNFGMAEMTNCWSMFKGCNKLVDLPVQNWDTSNVTNMSFMFDNCHKLIDPPVQNWDTSNVTDMSFMFNHCYALTSNLQIQNWNTSKVTTMNAMFQTDHALGMKTLHIENWDMSNVTDVGWMFWGQRELTSLDVSKWNTSKIQSFHHLFAHCTNLVPIGIENWDTSSATTFNATFHNTAATSYDISKWNTSNCESFSQMFEYCHNLQSIVGLDKIDTSNSKSFCEMFADSGLVELDLSNFNTLNADSTYIDPNNNEQGGMTQIFRGMTALKKIKLGENFSFNGKGNCTSGGFPSYTTDGKTGEWYSEDLKTYQPAGIPNRTKMTYYAIPSEVPTLMLTRYGSIYDIADAIRKKKKVNTKYLLSQMPEAISTIGEEKTWEIGEFSLTEDSDSITVTHNLGEVPGFILVWTDAFKDLPIPTDFHETAGFIWFNNLFGLPQRMTASSTYTESNATNVAFAVTRNDTTKRLALSGATSASLFPHDITAQSFTAPAPSASSKWRANVTYKYLVAKSWWENN